MQKCHSQLSTGIQSDQGAGFPYGACLGQTGVQEVITVVMCVGVWGAAGKAEELSKGRCFPVEGYQRLVEGRDKVDSWSNLRRLSVL